MKIINESNLVCPHCGFSEVLTMSKDSCLYFHECRQCRTLIKPEAGDCCVFCSYGTVPCPPVQKSRMKNGD